MEKMKGILMSKLQDKVFTNIMCIITIILLYNYTLSIEMLNVKRISFSNEYVYLMLMMLIIQFMSPKGDKLLYMSINLGSIATMLFVTVCTLDMHIATIGQATIFLDYHPLLIITMLVHGIAQWIPIKVVQYIMLKSYEVS